MWAPGQDLNTRYRTACEIAAALLDDAGERCLADYLLCAYPQHARQVATGVAVHALLRGVPHAWDALMYGGVADFTQASEWFDDTVQADFTWSPESSWLIGEGR